MPVPKHWKLPGSFSPTELTQAALQTSFHDDMRNVLIFFSFIKKGFASNIHNEKKKKCFLGCRIYFWNKIGRNAMSEAKGSRAVHNKLQYICVSHPLNMYLVEVANSLFATGITSLRWCSVKRRLRAGNDFLLKEQPNKISLCQCFALFLISSAKSFHQVPDIVVHKRG